MNISIIFSTYNRNNILEKTLNSFLSLDTHNLDWEIIAVDNAGNVETKKVIESFYATLPITYLVETKPGKNSALNRAIPYAKGELIIFTDDDIIAEPDWLKEMWEGAKRWPDCMIFGGRILPIYPTDTTPLNIDHPFLRAALAIADWNIDEGFQEGRYLCGPNMSIRSNIFKDGWRFNEKVGPQGSNYIVGSETEFAIRLENAGYKILFLPLALVYHQIRPEQLQLKWFFQRAFKSGRSAAFKNKNTKAITWFGIPRYLIKETIMSYFAYKVSIFSKNENVLFDCGVRYWSNKGMIYQFYKNRSFCDD